MTILIRLSSLIILTSTVNILINLQNKPEWLKEPDKRWEETICSPTYGAWGTIQGCRLNAKISPYEYPQTCWVYMGENIEKYNKCDIVFNQPTRTHRVLLVILFALLFFMLDFLFGGYPFLFFRILFYSFLFFPLLFLIELKLYFVHKEGFHPLRIFDFIYLSAINSIRNHQFLASFVKN